MRWREAGRERGREGKQGDGEGGKTMRERGG